MRKTFTTFTVRVSTTTAKILKNLPRGTKGAVVTDLVTNHPKTIDETVRRLTKKAA